MFAVQFISGVLFDILDLKDKISNNSNREDFVDTEISSVVFETGSNNISNETTMNLMRQNSEAIFYSQKFVNEIINDCILLSTQENSKGNFNFLTNPYSMTYFYY